MNNAVNDNMTHVESLLEQYRESIKIELDERTAERGKFGIEETIVRSREAFYLAERKETLSYHAFLYMQFKFMDKKWWLFQFIMLFSIWWLLGSVSEEMYIYIGKTLGVGAVLFVILLIPELWKNRSSNSMEIETAAYYSLRQIYSARMLLFGIGDVILLSAFAGASSVTLNIHVSEFIIMFLLPMSITACICFSVLCGRHMMSERSVIFICVSWSAVWLLVILNDNIYGMIAMPVWYALFIAAILYLGISIYRTLKLSNGYWEVQFDGIEA